MKVLIIHQNFPGQFRHMAESWSRLPGWEVIGLGRDTAPGMPVVKWLKYTLHRPPKQDQHPYLRQMETAVLHGQAVARSLLELKHRGFTPDAILAHPGWGESLYVRDVFPNARLIHFCEWYYGACGADLDFDPEFPMSFDARARIRTWNALHTLNLENCDAGVTPTHWQHSRHPEVYRDKIAVIHEGINTDILRPDPAAILKLSNGITLMAGEPVITYVARNLEPYRGFHVFMRALESIQKKHPTCHAVIVGGDGVSYGSQPKDAPTWHKKMLREVKLDPARTHFLGKVPYDTYRKVLLVSAAHIYLTYPFVLSWSMLEAMASGCLVIGSDTAPVCEVLQHGKNGLLADFFSPEDIAGRVGEALEQTDRMKSIRDAARQTVIEQYGFRQSLESYLDLINGASSACHALGNQEKSLTPVIAPVTASTVSRMKEMAKNTIMNSGIRIIKDTDLEFKELGLSPREVEIMRHLALGKGDKVIAAKLNISVKTVNHHVSNIILKLDAANRTHAVAKALMSRVIEMRSSDAASATRNRRFGERDYEQRFNA
ncbi:glycosyltransferase [Thiobacillus sp.]|uniref:glycosyltransferase n=1 Tax=Thiobacillus sp. TaxID=924 RepID=UPI0025FB6D52|nr:glycosyltransferase [Thiobacillus sp.]